MRFFAITPRPIALCAVSLISSTAAVAQQPPANAQKPIAPAASPAQPAAAAQSAQAAPTAQPQMQPNMMPQGMPMHPGWQGNMPGPGPMNPGPMQPGPMHPGMMQGQMPQPGMMQGPMMQGPGGPGMMHGPMMQGPGGPGMMHGPGMMQNAGPMGPPMIGMCPMGGPVFSAGRLAFIKAELGITTEQDDVYKEFAEALQKNVEAMHETHPKTMQDMMSAKTPADRFGARIKGMETGLGLMKTMKAAIDKLYDKLTDEQKEKANYLLPTVGCLH